MEILVYAEKSSDWKEIAKGLSINGVVDYSNWRATTSGFDWNDITVFWGAWHFYWLKNPKEIWIEYNLKSLPILPENIWYTEDNSFENKKALLKNAVFLLQSEKYDLLVFAWDAWREWLAILDRLYKVSKSKIPREYIWKGDSSKTEIRRLWDKRLKWTDKLISWEIINWLTESAHQRAIADWKIGMNFSQLYTLYYKLLNEDYIKFRIWRVITPTLNMIAVRENEINNFKPQKFYKYKTEYVEGFNWFLLDEKENEIAKFEKKNDIIDINSELVNIKEGEITNIEKKETKKNPSFWLNGSNIKLSKKLKITPKKVLDFIEEMYNKDGVMSYPRVESTHITESEYETIKRTIKFLEDNIESIPWIYKEIIPYIIKNNFKTTIPVVNNKKIIEWHGAFHVKISKWEISKKAIIELINWSDKKSIIFQKIINNNLQFFLPESITTWFDIKVKVGDYTFLTKESFLSRKGYKILDGIELGEQPEYLNNILIWDIINIDKYSIEEWKTKPPVRINTDNILVYMSHPEKLFESKSKDEEDLYNIIEKTEGIWQPATRQIIIENIASEEYAKIIKGDFYISEKWVKILDTIDNKTKDVLLTAKLEKWLNEIAYTNEKEHIDILKNYIDKYINHIIDKKIDNSILEKYEEKFNKKKQLIDLKSPEWFNLYLKEDKNTKWKFYVTSDENRGKDWYPLFYSLYDPIKKSLINNTICNTSQKCPKCSSEMNIFKSPKNEKLYIECSKRKSKSCDFVSLYDINKDKIITSDMEFLDHIKCECCESRVYVRKSKKDWNFYAICEYNNKDKKCDFIKQYDRNKKEFMLPRYMRNSNNTWLTYKDRELLENDKTFFTQDWYITIWKNIWWKDINLEIVTELINSWKTTSVINGFISQKGNTFSAKLKLVWNKVKYDF